MPVRSAAPWPQRRTNDGKMKFLPFRHRDAFSDSQWIRSAFSDLPDPRTTAHSDRDQRHWLVLAGGLALILSRATDAELVGRFPATASLYQAIRRGNPIDPNLVNDAMHEIVDVADPITKAAAKLCLHSCRPQPGGRTREAGLPRRGGLASTRATVGSIWSSIRLREPPDRPAEHSRTQPG